ncbi:hypothetical protein [Actinoplanes derwentensis]|uniref:Uncharacterized protein n=1 Tax=Actinoplanes derwentensis TaxID=113562 RepID=A0A1H2D0L2_9ACTN|nr:hypothetical protein [Actinoplanes derwentensis]GID85894.1 hypothetical protein Ade03nite_48180 [Actinoplanes derwentensis]SDT76134.1 hypothetical protein SAMN04489716_7522 [Actinoplanes derwentensis]
MHRDRVVRLLLAGALVMTAPACGEGEGVPADQTGPTGGWRTVGCEFSRPAQFMTAGGRRMPTTPSRLAAAMERIDRGGRERFADSFAGLEVDQAKVQAVVYRVPSGDFDDFIRASADDACVVVRDAAHPVSELTVWHDRVVADLPYWTAQGLRITTVGGRHDGSGVAVGTSDLERTRQELLARYGEHAPLIFVAEGPVRPLTP